MIISFSGASGSGKSRVIDELKKHDFFQGKAVKVKKEDDFFLINYSKKVLGEFSFEEYKNARLYDKKPKSTLFSIIVYFFYPLVVFFDYLIYYLYYEVLFKDKVLLCDRYVYDYLVTFKYNLAIDNFFNRVLLFNVPRPYSSFLLDISVDTAVSRNKNLDSGSITLSREFHSNVIEYYREIADRKNTFVVKNEDKTVPELIDEVVRAIKVREFFNSNKRIALCGIDGSGKTTLANKIQDYLSKLGVKSRVIHFYNEPVLFKLLKKFRLNTNLRLFRDESLQPKEGAKQNRRPLWWALLYYLDSLTQYLFVELFYFNKVLVYDRFFMDYVVSFEYYKVPHRKFFSKFSPRLNNTLFLNGDPVDFFERKPEKTLDFYRELLKIYSKYSKEFNLIIVDVDKKSKDEVLDEFLRLIQEKLK